MIGTKRPTALKMNEGASPRLGFWPASSEDHRRELALRRRRRAGEVPRLAEGLVALAQRHQAAGEVAHAGEGVRVVELAHHAHLLPGDRRVEDAVAEDRRRRRLGPVEVRRAAERHADAALLVRFHGHRGERGADLSLSRRRSVGEILGHRAVDGAVHVHALGADELGAGGGRASITPRWIGG